VYTGGFKAGKKHGKGVLKTSSGVTYQAEFVADAVTGVVEVAYSDGSKYIGELDHQTLQRQGAGSQVYANGDRYDGPWHGDVPDGSSSVLSFANGDMYTGDFKGGAKHGRGVFKLKSGEYYDGVFSMNTLNGAGKHCMPIGQQGFMVYEGEFKDNIRHGEGKMSLPNGNIYTGPWLNGKKEGKGVFEYFNGDVYTGDFKADKRTGYGASVFKDGERYEGEWLDGHFHGFGTYFHIHGLIEKGMWEQGEFNGSVKITSAPSPRSELVDDNVNIDSSGSAMPALTVETSN